MSAPPSDGPRPPRQVVSFVRRGSRLTRSRQDAWDRLAAQYVLDVPRGVRDTLPAPEVRLDPLEVFGRQAPLVVEIGSGQGENIAAAAARDPGRDHLAFEVYLPGVAETLDRLDRAGAPRNVRLLPLDALHAIAQLLPPGSVTEVWINFPDPWHKSRHHKRRLVNPPLLDALGEVLALGAVLRLATDWAEYAAHMRQVLDADDRLESLHPEGPRPHGETTDPVPADMPALGWAPRFDGRVRTSFERKAQDAGRLVWDLAYAWRGGDHRREG
ncbi:tRNA (guanosine(46)-N7)-methyltransferase TrmB [Brachybacterium sp. EF45031]|uniref:tRNA (guanosine(46)-N7)-methyltransferase TrmB n=1 Tax=Brachybacterium sillae TaxID=2810536 RepID=UPI00217DE493|nr:tRNA (guanosine(46)-N7)-methyltransferase TrmB [Brachybacterium sillae]MCS6712268.1 tRNA (guanosine(46)-N7)-methyltransferase TrmB [Brachybacterium sillae]